MDLQARYADLIEHEYQRLSQPRKHGWALSAWVFKYGDGPSLKRTRWVVLAGILMGFAFTEGVAQALFHFLPSWDADDRLGFRLSVYLIECLACIPLLSDAPRTIQAVLKRNCSQPAADGVDSLASYLASDERLWELVKAMLMRDGVNQITQAQVNFLRQGAERIATWRELDRVRQQGLDTLDRADSVVSQARSQLRSNHLTAMLPVAQASNTPPPRF